MRWMCSHCGSHYAQMPGFGAQNEKPTPEMLVPSGPNFDRFNTTMYTCEQVVLLKVHES
jgi:hypothetical protein